MYRRLSDVRDDACPCPCPCVYPRLPLVLVLVTSTDAGCADGEQQTLVVLRDVRPAHAHPHQRLTRPAWVGGCVSMWLSCHRYRHITTK